MATSEPVLELSRLSRRFGATTALDAVSLALARGAVYGLVGANGAGKTTLIRHLLGLLRAESGSVRVFGLDPVADPVGVLSRIGYLSEENDLPAWMRIDELVRYSRAFYPAWDDTYCASLLREFALDPAAKVGTLSKGQKARAGLLVALAHRPELLVLDEPSSGLDPIVRRDILGAVLRTVADEGRTVLFSSHLLEEVAQVADHVTMIHRGTIALSAPLGAILQSHLWLTVRCADSRSRPPALAGLAGIAGIAGIAEILSWSGGGREWTALARGDSADLRAALAGAGLEVVAERAPSLDEIFVAHVGAAGAPTREE